MVDLKPMLNLYPDSIGRTLADAGNFLAQPELKDVFSSVYVLPSLFHSDLDRGFCVVDYDLNEDLATKCDLDKLRFLGLTLKLDIVLNHASLMSPQFQDLIKKGDSSEYRDFFIDWNKFWAGCGEMTAEGYIQPNNHTLRICSFGSQGSQSSWYVSLTVVKNHIGTLFTRKFGKKMGSADI